MHAVIDPGIAEWDILYFGMTSNGRERGELKRLSTRRKKNQLRFGK